MMTIGRGRTLYVDVDNTLIRPAGPRPADAPEARVVGIGGYPFEIIESTLDTLRRFAANEDTTIIVWSNGGARWAAQVVEALFIDHLVAACLSKPTWYADDEYQLGVIGPDRYIPVR